jgi:TPP-dependent pyruvate/acetoin dehydrogenase alpha subunit
VADAVALEEIQKEVRSEMKAAVEFAIAAPYPKPQEAGEDVYA